jgi:hypothetical protein
MDAEFWMFNGAPRCKSPRVVPHQVFRSPQLDLSHPNLKVGVVALAGICLKRGGLVAYLGGFVDAGALPGNF